MRQFFQIVVPLLLPTLLYFLYLKLARRRAGGGNAPPEVPWAWLGIAGAALVAVTLGAAALIGGAPPGSHYEPAKVIDGKIVPGQFSD
jgi:hypothetical protein